MQYYRRGTTSLGISYEVEVIYCFIYNETFNVYLNMSGELNYSKQRFQQSKFSELCIKEEWEF